MQVYVRIYCPTLEDGDKLKGMLKFFHGRPKLPRTSQFLKIDSDLKIKLLRDNFEMSESEARSVLKSGAYARAKSLPFTKYRYDVKAGVVHGQDDAVADREEALAALLPNDDDDVDSESSDGEANAGQYCLIYAMPTADFMFRTGARYSQMVKLSHELYIALGGVNNTYKRAIAITAKGGLRFLPPRELTLRDSYGIHETMVLTPGTSL